jgi:Protein of unknown function (DUF2933)
MNLGALFFLLLILACPLMMVWMMRGHGGHGDARELGHHHTHGGVGEMRGRSLDDLRHRRAELDAEIATFEEAETEAKPPAVV